MVGGGVTGGCTVKRERSLVGLYDNRLEENGR